MSQLTTRPQSTAAQRVAGTREYRAMRAFTLLELLIVVAVVGILFSLACSAFRIVREAARTVQCASNLREQSVAFTVFVGNNNGRYPGGGSNPWSVAWNDILNQEVFAQEGVSIARSVGGTKAFNCPAYPTQFTVRPFAINGYANGGTTSSDPTKSYPYGIKFVPGSLHGAQWGSWGHYFLGAKQARFAAPSAKILVQEQNRSGDIAWATGGVWNQQWMGRFQIAKGGGYAYRHNSGTRANFLFIDGHVAALAPDPQMDVMIDQGGGTWAGNSYWFTNG